MTKTTGYNTRLAQWGLTSLIENLCFYCKFVLVDNLVFQNPPLRQAWERYKQPCDDRQSNNKPTEKRPEMPTAQNGTFGFARHTSQRFAKPKEPFFCKRTDIVST